jgi:hypothetical protein
MNRTTEGNEHPTACGVLGWGVYCASSWTWCIGMYLPIIMLRLFGWPGYLVFAIPNLVGLIAFGYLCDARRSRAILREHRPAIRLFSSATAAFQLFFLAWAWSLLAPGGNATNGALIALGAWALSLALAAMPDRAWVPLGVAAWLTSIGLFIWFLVAHAGAGLAVLPATGELGARELTLLAPAIAFGLLLCPWLDGTFHRARIRSRSAHTFTVFGVAFAPMILFTCAYTIGGVIAIGGIVLAQLTVQASFTAAVHVRETWLGGVGAAEDRASPWPWGAVLPAIAILLGTLPALAGETTYLRFLGLFGLVFPAYVLLFIARKGGQRPGSTSLALFILLIIPCALLYDWAFMERQTGYALIAVGILLALAILIHLASRGRTRA